MRTPISIFRSRISRRLSSMIDWRVRQAYEAERNIILETNRTMIELSAEMTDRVTSLERAILELRKSLSAGAPADK